jgi:hypothetical protein
VAIQSKVFPEGKGKKNCRNTMKDFFLICFIQTYLKLASDGDRSFWEETSKDYTNMFQQCFKPLSIDVLAELFPNRRKKGWEILLSGIFIVS